MSEFGTQKRDQELEPTRQPEQEQEQEHAHEQFPRDLNLTLADDLRRWATNPNTPQPPNMRAYYRLAAMILLRLQDGDEPDCNMCAELRLFFNREQWDNPVRALEVALTTTATIDYVSRAVGDMSRTVGDMVSRYWNVASEGQDISTLDGNVRYSFALVASGIL
jgi:hypothetical protein